MKSALPFAALLALAACQKKEAAPQPPANPQAAATTDAPSPAAADPPRLQKMICRNSQTGAKAECGTPNAVMVGMEPQK